MPSAGSVMKILLHEPFSEPRVSVLSPQRMAEKQGQGTLQDPDFGPVFFSLSAYSHGARDPLS
jgi:hypothetical protein